MGPLCSDFMCERGSEFDETTNRSNFRPTAAILETGLRDLVQAQWWGSMFT